MRYVALLRGINVGRAHRVPMADLRSLLTELGCTEVRTHLNSGNAVFRAEQSSANASALQGQLEPALAARFGFAIPCLLRTDAELAAVVEANPLAGTAFDGAKLMVHFHEPAADRRAPPAAADPRSLAPVDIFLGPDVVYQWCPDGLLAAPSVGAFLTKHWGTTVTARNWNTVEKLADLLAQ